MPASGSDRPAFPPDGDALEAGRKLLAGPAWLVTGAASPGGFPATDTPEVAFWGRSNVGKSRLLNALAGRRALARVSGTPGRTRQLNFFMAGNGRLMLVDLPGYGHAEAPLHVVRAWTGLCRHYLASRQSLLRVMLLIDSRHGLLKADRRMIGFLECARVPWQPVLTGIDRISAAACEQRRRELPDSLGRHGGRPHLQVLATSAVNGQGIPELRGILALLAAGGHDRQAPEQEGTHVFRQD